MPLIVQCTLCQVTQNLGLRIKDFRPMANCKQCGAPLCLFHAGPTKERGPHNACYKHTSTEVRSTLVLTEKLAVLPPEGHTYGEQGDIIKLPVTTAEGKTERKREEEVEELPTSKGTTKGARTEDTMETDEKAGRPNQLQPSQLEDWKNGQPCNGNSQHGGLQAPEAITNNQASWEKWEQYRNHQDQAASNTRAWQFEAAASGASSSNVAPPPAPTHPPPILPPAGSLGNQGPPPPPATPPPSTTHLPPPPPPKGTDQPTAISTPASAAIALQSKETHPKDKTVPIGQVATIGETPAAIHNAKGTKDEASNSGGAAPTPTASSTEVTAALNESTSSETVLIPPVEPENTTEKPTPLRHISEWPKKQIQEGPPITWGTKYASNGGNTEHNPLSYPRGSSTCEGTSTSKCSSISRSSEHSTRHHQ